MHFIPGEEVLPTQMQPVQVQDFDGYLAKYEPQSQPGFPIASCYPIRYVGQEAILALLLDYDGTLSPIAPHPDLATIPPETKKVLEPWKSMMMVIL